MNLNNLIAIDPSLTCSGWALFSIESSKLLGVGKMRSLPPSIPLSNRLRDLQDRIHSIITKLRLCQNDVLVCEAETSMKDPKAAIKVEQVRGIFESVARTNNICVPGRISPRSVQSEIIGLKGVQAKREVVKQSARSIVASMFGRELGQLGFDATEANLARNQDIVDAILVGMLSVSKIKLAITSGETPEVIFSESKKQRRRGRHSWGTGEENSFGWNMSEIKKLAGVKN